jgi:hypothetical protein
MHFTIDRQRLVKMIETIHRARPGTRRNAKVFRLYACAARVFVEANGVTAGEEALVLRDGGCTQPIKQFLALLKSYSNKENVTIEADERTLKLFTSTMNVSGYTASVTPPADFVVGRVTDTWLSGGVR